VFTRYILDGSNLAYDGSKHPSFRRLTEAAKSLGQRDPKARITVCVDASLANTLQSDSERADYLKASRRRQIWTAPAGVPGRGDAWVVAVAVVASLDFPCAQWNWRCLVTG
jgi:hypothetical protein